MRNVAALVLVLSCLSPAVRGANAPHATGKLKLSFTERSPLSAKDVMERRRAFDPRQTGGMDARLRTQEWDYDLAAESFDVVVPPGYNPKVPHGLLVWTGVSRFSSDWFDVLARHKLIFVAAEDRQQKTGYVPPGLWLDAVHNLKAMYNVDDQRIYASGFSAGGRAAHGMLVTYPDVFRGSFSLACDDFYIEYQHTATVEPTAFTWHGPLDRLKKEVRIAMLRGERDTFTPEQGRLQYDALVLDGFEHVTFLVAPGLGHQHPGAAWFEKGIDALDAPPTRTPPTTAPTSDPKPQPGQSAQAKRLLATANFWRLTSWPGNPGPREARRYLRRVIDEYPTTSAANEARTLLAKLDEPAKRFAAAATTRSAAPTGTTELTFAERSPLGEPDEVRRRAGADLAKIVPKGAENEAYHVADEVFEVVVPAGYKQGGTHGVFVWMGLGKFPRPYLAVLSRHNLILVAPRNLRASLAQYQLALDGAYNVARLYETDPNRTYIAGYGFGGASAAAILRAYPEVFHGGYFLLGGSFDAANANDKDVRLVLLRGGKDAVGKAESGRKNAEALRAAGFANVTYLEVPGLGSATPDAKWFEKGLAALDGKP